MKLVRALGILKCINSNGFDVKVRITPMDLGEVGLSVTK